MVVILGLTLNPAFMRGSSILLHIDPPYRKAMPQIGQCNLFCISRIQKYYSTFSFQSFFLVACTRLYKPLCRSVRLSVGPSVSRSIGRSLIARSTRLMAIDLVSIEEYLPDERDPILTRKYNF